MGDRSTTSTTLSTHPRRPRERVERVRPVHHALHEAQKVRKGGAAREEGTGSNATSSRRPYPPFRPRPQSAGTGPQERGPVEREFLAAPAGGLGSARITPSVQMPQLRPEPRPASRRPAERAAKGMNPKTGHPERRAPTAAE